MSLRISKRLLVVAATLGCMPPISPAIANPKITKAQVAAYFASSEQIAASASVINDPYSKFIEVNTETFYREKDTLLQIDTSDEFLRAFVDRKTGEITLQIYFAQFHGGEWIFYERLAYIDTNGPETVETTTTKQDLERCSTYSCDYREDVIAEIPESALRAAAIGAVPGTPGIWKFKVIGKGGQGVERAFLKTEIAGFLLAVDSERSKVLAASAELQHK